MPNEREIEIARLVKFPENRDDLARLLKDYRLDLGMNRAELTAPAEGDVEAATKLKRQLDALYETSPATTEENIIIEETLKRALTTARKAERENSSNKINAAYERGDITESERDASKLQARVKALEAAAGEAAEVIDQLLARMEIPLAEPLVNNVMEIKFINARDKLVALLAGEGKGEEAEREGGAGRDALEEVE